MVHRRLAFLLGLFSALAVSSCRGKPAEQPQNNVAAPAAEPKPTPTIPLPEPKLEREQLILAALHAISASALGIDDSEAQKELKGREFELRLRFGCPGATAAANSPRNWTYDDKKKVLRAHADADLNAETVPASDLLLKGYEGIAGFTIQRPLLLSAGCPAPQFAAATASGPTIAIAQLFTSGESRVQRPERSYEITKAIEPSDKPTQGLDLVVGGRLDRLSDGRVIHCGSKDGAPTCIIAAKVDRVAIENPASDAVLGQWSQW